MNLAPRAADSASDMLFSTRPVAAEMAADGPLIVVGLPRSGSSFLSEIISQIDGWYVFDDLYLQRHAEGLGANGPLTPQQLDGLLHYLGWQIRARLRSNDFAVPAVALDEIEPMNDALRESFRGRAVTWEGLQEEWMMRLALRRGCARWGYKLPQAFLALPQLRRAYPGMRTIFLMRSPQDVLASFKHMPKGAKDGDPGQYHPLAYAQYWRMAARAAARETARDPQRAMLLRFEDMRDDVQGQATRIAAFLGTPLQGEVTPPPKPNSSFSGARRTITGLEARILRRLAGREAAALGYAIDAPPLRLGDLADLLAVTGRFTGYMAGRMRRKTGVAQSVRRFIGGAFGAKRP